MLPQMTSHSTPAESQPTAADHTVQPFADDGQIAVVLLTKWLDWITQKNHDVFVALPIIQRGSVWGADKIATLWDSLLRGMPVGCLTVSRFPNGKTEIIRDLGDKMAHEKSIKEGSLALLDGQQRTLAMCIGWPWEKEMDRRVWVDFGQPGVGGQPFRLRVTTKYQPFGFNQHNHSKLTRSEKRNARKEFDENDENAEFKGKPDYDLPLDRTKPYLAEHPLELRTLIQDWQNSGQSADHWCQKVTMQLSLHEEAPKKEIENRVHGFAIALKRLFEMQIALVRVAQNLVEHVVDDKDESTEPDLVVLFERIANAGAPLSRADYVFSLIKHRFPDAHNFVQDLHAEPIVSSLLTANDLVMTAVRLAANTHTPSGEKQFADIPTPSPKEFGRMLKAKISPNEGDFLETALMPLIRRNSSFNLLKSFQVAHRLLAFREDSNLLDAGLPKLAFPLLQRQLVQVLVLWIHRRQRAGVSDETLRRQFDDSRADILRFVLFWLLCVGDREKDKEAAGKIAFSILRDDHDLFPGKALYERLCENNLATPLCHPDAIRDIAMAPLGSKTVRNWVSRFGVNDTDSPTIREPRQLYARWFSRERMLLWLQRKTLAVTFKDADPLAGRDEETPYDYDHICPRDDWASDGRSRKSTLKQFCQCYTQAWLIGNSIGNYCILESSANRSFGKSSPAVKLNLVEIDSPETQIICEGNAINQSEAEGFKNISSEESEQGEWDQERALAFQKVVEARAFRLYEQYFKDGCFDEWILISGGTDKSDAETVIKIDVKL